MQKVKKFNRFAYVYEYIRRQHPNWTHGQISHCTAYALRNKKTGVIHR